MPAPPETGSPPLDRLRLLSRLLVEVGVGDLLLLPPLPLPLRVLLGLESLEVVTDPPDPLDPLEVDLDLDLERLAFWDLEVLASRLRVLVLDLDRRRETSFLELEAAVGLESFRPYLPFLVPVLDESSGAPVAVAVAVAVVVLKVVVVAVVLVGVSSTVS